MQYFLKQMEIWKFVGNRKVWKTFVSHVLEVNNALALSYLPNRQNCGCQSMKYTYASKLTIDFMTCIMEYYAINFHIHLSTYQVSSMLHYIQHKSNIPHPDVGSPGAAYLTSTLKEQGGCFLEAPPPPSYISTQIPSITTSFERKS